MREISFSELVNSPSGANSVEESEFMKHFCAKEVLHIAQDDRRRFEHLLPWDKINEILSLNLLDRKRLRITRDGRDLPPAFYRSEESERDPIVASKLQELLKQNASVVLNRVQDLSPPVRRMATQMERALNQKLNVNGYATFGAGGAFSMHYDSHDVFVMQVYGTKHWFIYDEPELSPTDEEKKKAKKPAPRNVVFETVLQAGDALYVPRGTYHRAQVTDTDSVHLTFGIHTSRGVDFIDWLRPKLQDESLFREDILTVCGEEALARRERVLKDRLCAIINEASLSEFLEKWQRSRKPLDQFRLGPPVKIDDKCLLAPLLRYAGAWRRALQEKGQEPSVAGERVLEALLEKQFATVSELKAELGSVLDEDTLESTVAELVDGCWIEVVAR
jgi:cupin superfamily protein